MDIKLSEGFCKTIADILDYCVEGHTDSCTIKMNVNENTDIKIDMHFEVLKTEREQAESEYIEKQVISKRDRAFLDYLRRSIQVHCKR